MSMEIFKKTVRLRDDKRQTTLKQERFRLDIRKKLFCYVTVRKLKRFLKMVAIFILGSF